VIEVAGSPESLQAAIDFVRPGGTIAAIGVFSTESFNLNLSDVFLRDISLHMNGFANVQPFVQGAADLLQSGKIHADDLFTHDFKLRDIDKAYVIVELQRKVIHQLHRILIQHLIDDDRRITANRGSNIKCKYVRKRFN
jgi:threonine dehydrogenase-like Zn-dependent dehydrogenase